MIQNNRRDLQEESIDIRPYAHFEQVRTQHIHNFYITGEIGEAALYVDMIHRIRTASDADVVYIYINTHGGDLSAGMQIINAMNASAAHIICVVDGEAHSLGNLIFLSGDEFIVHDNCMMMFHDYSGGVMGKGSEQRSQLDATNQWFSQLARDVYVPFMSESELENILDGKDHWMLSTEIRERLINMVAVLAETESDNADLADTLHNYQSLDIMK